MDQRRADHVTAIDTVNRLSLTRKVIYSLVPLFTLLILTEAYFRLAPNPHDRDDTNAGLAIPDPDLIWRLKPADHGPLRTNSLGFRDDEPEPGVDLRILLLGDSVAWGDGVPRREAVFPQVAERILQSRIPDRRIEIINSAVLGYSTFQQRRYLELRGLDLDPDMLVLQFCLNDVTERYERLAAYGGGNVFLGVDTRQAIPGLFGWMVRHSRAFEAMVRTAIRISRSREGYAVSRLSRDVLGDELERAWEETLGEMVEIEKIARREGIPLLIVITPYRYQLEDPDGLSQPQRRLASWARQRGIPVVDLLADFARFSRSASGIELFRDESHFSVDGHAFAARMTADAILSEVRRRNLLP